jgi:Zn-dependent peptidase ImmA (M78 family)
LSDNGPITDARAHALRDRYHAVFGARELPVPVESIAEDLLGLSVEEAQDLPASGLLLPSRREIWLNASERESEGRLRFTLAHEIGHWICHCQEDSAPPVLCRSEDVDLGADRVLEREANVFAAELLMQESSVRKRFGENRDPDQLARAFGVSGEAMRWRLYSFGLTERPTSHAV